MLGGDHPLTVSTVHYTDMRVRHRVTLHSHVTIVIVTARRHHYIVCVDVHFRLTLMRQSVTEHVFLS